MDVGQLLCVITSLVQNLNYKVLYIFIVTLTAALGS